LGEWGGNLLSKVREVIPVVITAVVNFFKDLPNKIGYAIGFVIGKLVQWGQNIGSWIKTNIPILISNVVTFFKELPSKISSAISSAITKIGEWCTSMKSKAVSGIKNVVSGVIDGFKKLPSKLTSVGKNIVEGLWKGIKNAKDWLIGKIKEFAGSITDGIKDALGIESPSRVMRDEVGKFISERIGVGITENADAPINALESLGDDMSNQALGLNGATINRKLSATFDASSSAYNDTSLMSKLDSIYERLGRLQMVTDTGALVGEILDRIDAGLAEKQLLNARRV
jgi:phage-related protein